MGKHLITIIGPTAIGKTTLAIKIANYFKTEIVSADSRQFYKEMNIGTAKPSTSELNSIKHHLINNKSVNDDYNIYDYEKDALKSIESIFNKNDIAILVGGSGLYINTVLYGLDEMPGISTEVRNSLYLDLELKGIKKLQEKLKLLDPSSYRSIDINNPRRLIRALEVSISTGKSYSSFLKKKKKKRDFNIIVLGMNQERLDLYKKINTRVDNMVESGLINEVKELYTLKGLNTLNTIGYSEVFNYIEDKYSLDECINEIKKNTRRYAKRQLTWFKSIDRVEWITPDYTFEKVIAYIKSLIGN
ncbi:MAG: tRNA (adenosine(37)-N6)-dimethylallyltransferase MiaA [Flavobacteriaceae bacterium]|jgi:tRNA dimethylallyltransferase|nr:tRNA (adenosine(37)-N6)-dimethylallyltransferase MiaA [Flavobacteriaceae bacterium]MBT4112454.1 tRNA (adenosine(37)-N6)-dimethylallyltransferase MiaA [Flavobacteriaceae bacterium]MBT4614308.1 tRNA (adenosine(37)-N6)-dimethylallyltransferase MiaA [Flavobacteriaceae bacterium]MBT5246761.1 tRNA (adenosine(37)-N6)-dimethylallyltransferase MiaA [Flavobacteriaceae bacterium]MBT5649946.1 tRNA (adenosine(37)-N6)-dimethylallyltransferase MiaA [Flavobacteriaceae bacterium]